ncbi:hypothetical protein J7J12_02775, partial [bacterium]|nr:hypothetical protein [bacterium]
EIDSYELKRHTIQNCLYGVDIDPGAVEIAKLRLWLSLVVDEKDIKRIKPLPNLDYKIMQGNSLIELLSEEFLKSSIDQRRIELINKFKKAKDELFNISSSSQKRLKRQEINELIKELFKYDRNLIIKNLKQEIKGIQNQGRLFTDARFKREDKKRMEELKKKIEEVQKIKVPGPSKHFEWHINFSEVFQEKGGFDIVIANPPYGNILTPQEKKDISKKYKSYTGEIAAIFIEKYLNLLREHGVVVNIITLALAYHISLSYSRYLLQNNFKKTILFTFDRDPVGLFGAMSQSVCIFLSSDYKKDCNGRFYTSKFLRTTREIVDNIDLVIRNLPVQLANNHLLGDKIGVSFTEKHRLPKIGDKIAVNILNKIKKQPIQIKDIISKKGEKLIIRTSGNYWYNSFDKKPYESVEIKEIYVENLYYRNFLLVLINSSLFYLFGRIYGDGRHLPIGFLGLFPIPDGKEIINYSKEIKTLSEKFMEQLFSVFNLKNRQFQSSQIKHSIDRLDKFLAKIYHFSKEELEYILNYDSCIRNKKIQECAPN